MGRAKLRLRNKVLSLVDTNQLAEYFDGAASGEQPVDATRFGGS